MTLAASVLLCCTAAAPQAGGDTSGIDQQRPRPGVWAVPDLVPNDAGTTDSSTISTGALATAAAEGDTVEAGAAGTSRSSGSSGAPPITLSATAKGIPARILTAYKEATDRLADDLPGCHLPWELLAAIGRVESGHAVGRPLTADGTVTRPVLGPALNGLGGVALIRDTDNGALDGDTRYDRAVGPMQFIPTTWATSGRDGNGDGRRDPHNIYDATLAAGHYLCARGRDLTDPGQLRAAIYSYNPSDAYVRTVLTWMAGYRQGGATAQPGDVSAPDAIPIIRLTPNAVPPPTSHGGDPATPPPTPSPGLAPSPTGPGPSPAGPGCPALEPSDFTLTPTDLDPANPGPEALDLSVGRTPWPATSVTIQIEVTSAGIGTGTSVGTTISTTLPADRDPDAPALLARVLDAAVAATPLSDLTLAPADGTCSTVLRLRIGEPRPDTPTPPPAVPPPATATPGAPPVAPSSPTEQPSTAPAPPPTPSVPPPPSSPAAPPTPPLPSSPAAPSTPTPGAPASPVPATTVPATTVPATTSAPRSEATAPATSPAPAPGGATSATSGGLASGE